MKIYGYINISSRDQIGGSQEVALLEFGVERQNIMVEKIPDKDFARPVYKSLVRKLEEGDVLVLKSIDRLGRSYDEILEQWQFLTKEKKIEIVVLDMPLLDTRQGTSPSDVSIADVALQLLAYLAQAEREFLHKRQAEGIAAAKARGVKFGRSALPKPDNYKSVADDWRAGKISGRKAAELLSVSPRTFKNWVSD